MKIIYGDLVIDIEPGEEERTANLVRALRQLPRRGPHPRGRGIARRQVNTARLE